MSKSQVEEWIKAEGVSGPLADIVRSIYSQESGSGKNTKTSNAGAVGGMQIIPSTFKSVADKDWDISNPEHNGRAGIRYLEEMYKKAGGDPALTAIGYYGGPGGIEKAKKGIPVSDPRNPNAPNTFQYAQQVVGRMGKDIPVPVETNPMQSMAALNKIDPYLALLNTKEIPMQQEVPKHSLFSLGNTEAIPTPTMNVPQQSLQGMDSFGRFTGFKSEEDAWRDLQSRMAREDAQVSNVNNPGMYSQNEFSLPAFTSSPAQLPINIALLNSWGRGKV